MKSVSKNPTSCNQNDIHSPTINNVINLSKSVTLSENEKAVLSLGLNFSVAPKSVPTVDIIADIERGLIKLPSSVANEVRVHLKHVLVSKRRVPDNLSNRERQVINKLKKNDQIVILPADKGCATVLLDRSEYDDKLNAMLSDGSYEKLRRNPTGIYEAELKKILEQLVKRGELSKKERLYYDLKPSHSTVPFIYGLPKIHKPGAPLRPIVNTISSVSYSLSKYLAKIISPLVGETTSFVKNSCHFTEILHEFTPPDNFIQVSFDVTSLFTNVPIKEALQIVSQRLSENTSILDSTPLSKNSVLQLLEFCLTTTYFSFNDSIYKQTDGAAMGSCLSPIISNLYMEFFEDSVLDSAVNKPSLWLRYVDDVYCIWPHDMVCLNLFLLHINSFRPSIQFTMEIEQKEILPFLDISVSFTGGILSTSVYRKPTHTDRYLHYRSYHSQSTKTGIIKTLQHRAKHTCSSDNIYNREIQHLQSAFQMNGYPKSFIKKAIHRDNQGNTQQPKEKPRATICTSYIQGISEKVRRICNKFNIRTVFKAPPNLRNILTKVKPSISKNPKGQIYKIPCSCGHVYIGETGRTLDVRLKEHKASLRLQHYEKSAVAEHQIDNPSHAINWDRATSIHQCSDWLRRGYVESIYIRKNINTIYNRDRTGRANVSGLWDDVLKRI